MIRAAMIVCGIDEALSKRRKAWKAAIRRSDPSTIGIRD